ncbi:hypothetical protein [Vibrio owensii]|uniref:hypothetical protein n=1 Tax=Vibrio harveyi group TaxID=717610 RepID=UPI003CC6BDA5
MSLEFLKDEGMPEPLKTGFSRDYLLQVFRANSQGGIKEDVLMEMDRLLDLPVQQRNVAFESILSEFIENNNKQQNTEEEEIYF